ncbi:GNAT family N-acetyltransferase [Streptomyces sp. KLOTTS4A1]|uniref:GNAT family N-acetyltransferase n=1 Tax=Streptomyces sp. KLOTTS4A1 TaxID=3390996 RepID=UPI0039F509C7
MTSMTLTIETVPDLDRPGIGAVLASTWDAKTPERQDAAIAAIVKTWESRPWPAEGPVAYSVFKGTDGASLLHLSQWRRLSDHDAFVARQRTERNTEIDDAVPGIERRTAVPGDGVGSPTPEWARVRSFPGVVGGGVRRWLPGGGASAPGERWVRRRTAGARSPGSCETRRMILRPATRAELPAVLALLADESQVVDPESVLVGEAHERAFEAIRADARNEMLVLVDGTGLIVGCAQLTYIPGLGQAGRERALVEAVRVRADRRGEGLGAELMRLAVDRARDRGCGLMQLTSNKRRDAAHRFYERLGFARSHEGFKLSL